MIERRGEVEELDQAGVRGPQGVGTVSVVTGVTESGSGPSDALVQSDLVDVGILLEGRVAGNVDWDGNVGGRVGRKRELRHGPDCVEDIPRLVVHSVDISVAALAYDGNTVRAAPRAAFSLITRTQVVTPHILNEKRNRQRIIKYYKRGYSAYLLDPYCNHAFQCDHGLKLSFPFYEKDEDPASKREHVPWTVHDLKGDDYSPEFNYRVGEKDCMVACCSVEPGKSGEYCTSLFEVEKGHALEFFAKRNGWNDHQKSLIAKCCQYQCWACKPCRYEYALWLVFSRDPRVNLLDAEFLSGNISYRQGERVGLFGGFCPSFYGCGAFEPTLVRTHARSVYEQLGTLHSQLVAERARYLVKHLGEKSALKRALPVFFKRFVQNGELSDRFVYNDDLSHLFTAASSVRLPKSKKSPVGLNPERFMETCTNCGSYIIGCEYGTEFCYNCSRQGNKKWRYRDSGYWKYDSEEEEEEKEDANNNDTLGQSSTQEDGSDNEKRKLRATVAAQAKELDELKATLKNSKPIETVDLTQDEADVSQAPAQDATKPKSQLAALHDQAQAMREVKVEAIDRAVRAEQKVEEVMLQLECPICFETKDESTALGCGHVMCSECAREHAKEACPTCRKAVETRISLYKSH